MSGKPVNLHKTSQRKSVGKQLQIIVLSMFTLLFVIFAIAGLLATLTDSSNKDGQQSTPQLQPLAAKGAVVSDGGFSFIVHSLKCGEKRISFNFAYTEYYSDAQGQYCRANVTITNTGSEANSTSGRYQILLNDQGQRYEFDSTATGHAARIYAGDQFHEDINPGNSITGDLVFDVPVNVIPTVAEFHGEYDSKGARVSL